MNKSELTRVCMYAILRQSYLYTVAYLRCSDVYVMLLRRSGSKGWCTLIETTLILARGLIHMVRGMYSLVHTYHRYPSTL